MSFAISGSNDDIRNYLLSRIHKKGRLSSFLERDSTLESRLVDEVIKAAKGMFLLAKLQVDLVSHSHTKHGLLKNLQILPTGLDQSYDQSLARIAEQADADAILAQYILILVSHSFRPLSLVELQHALTLYDSSGSVLHTDLVAFEKDDAVSEDIILSICMGLVSVDYEDKEVRLVHLTLQPYLQRLCSTQWHEALNDISRICLLCISSSDLVSGPASTDEEMSKRLATYPFLRYAGRYWGCHIQITHDVDSQAVLDIICHEKLRHGMVQIMHLPKYERELFVYSGNED